MESREIEEVTSNLKDDVFETLIQAMKRSNEGDVEEALAICKRVITMMESAQKRFSSWRSSPIT